MHRRNSPTGQRETGHTGDARRGRELSGRRMQEDCANQRGRKVSKWRRTCGETDERNERGIKRVSERDWLCNIQKEAWRREEEDRRWSVKKVCMCIPYPGDGGKMEKKESKETIVAEDRYASVYGSCDSGLPFSRSPPSLAFCFFERSSRTRGLLLETHMGHKPYYDLFPPPPAHGLLSLSLSRTSFRESFRLCDNWLPHWVEPSLPATPQRSMRDISHHFPFNPSEL